MDKLVPRASGPLMSLPNIVGCKWGYVGSEPPDNTSRRAFDRAWDSIDWQTDEHGDWGYIDIQGVRWAVCVNDLDGETSYAYFMCKSGPVKPNFGYNSLPNRLRTNPTPKHPMADIYGTGGVPFQLTPSQMFPTKKMPKRQR